MNKQLDIFSVHEEDNNKESQENLNKNRKFFNKKCRLVFDWLLAGQELTVLGCTNNGVSSLPRRKKDLADKGVKISDTWQDGVKVYFMSEADKEFNKKFVDME